MGSSRGIEVSRYGIQRQAAHGILWKLAQKLIYSKVQEAFGGRVRVFVSGGAPLGIDTAKWFASVGIALWEGYGLPRRRGDCAEHAGEPTDGVGRQAVTQRGAEAG